MCGIAGFSGSFSSSLLEKMKDSIAHRGPDDSGIWNDPKNCIGLAHTRLSIIDLSPAGHQPMWDNGKRAVISFNGEIYNYRELIDKLSKKGYTFKSNSDTEVLLNAYLCFGFDMLLHLKGIFAFAIWDSEKKILFVARDPCGVKPLYFCENNNGFIFASELKAILQEHSISRELDPVSIDWYLRYLWCPAPRTMLKSIRKLKPGQAMIVSQGKIQKVWIYYQFPFCNGEITKRPIPELIHDTQYLLRQAVHRQMVADVPVGAFLSGGLDSSAIVHFARELGKDFDCFTIGLKDNAVKKEGFVDDLPYAKRVANHLGVKLHIIDVGPEMANLLQKMIYHLDEPQADPAPLNVLFISELAKSHGIKVLLSGAGGDDIFSGYRRHYALMHEKYWDFLPIAIRRIIGKTAHAVSGTTPLRRRFTKAFQYAGLSKDERLLRYFYWISPEDQLSLYSSEFHNKLLKEGVIDPLEESLAETSANTEPLNRMLYLECKHFLADHNLNYTDKMSMAAGVEVRVPFLDTDLVQFAASLPSNVKQRGNTGKWILKKAMEPYLPRDIIFRPKSGFGAPVRSWLRNQLKSMVNDILSERSLQNRGIFNFHAVSNLIKANENGTKEGAYTILSLLCIELWCRTFLDKR